GARVGAGADMCDRCLRVDMADVADQERHQAAAELTAVLDDAVHQVLEVGQVGELPGLFVRELGDHLAGAAARHPPRVHGLQRALARPGAGHRIDAVAALAVVHASPPRKASCDSRCAISIAASAASSPLLPWLPPARASASSWRSTASTPFITGTPWSSATRIRPSLQPSATCS